MPGYDRAKIVDVNTDDLDQFTCAICLHLLKNARVVPCCGLMYCDGCINNWLGVNQSCPNDRKKLSRSKLRSPPREVFIKPILPSEFLNFFHHLAHH